MNLRLNEKIFQQFKRLNKAIPVQRKFKLLVAVFNHYPFRDRLVRELNRSFPGSKLLDIGKDIPGTFEAFSEKLTQLSRSLENGDSPVIQVANNGKQFYNETIPLFFKGLDYQREAIADANPVTIILWMRDQDAKDFLRIAPNMRSWHGGIFDFELPKERYHEPTPPPFLLISPEEKKKKEERISEILAYIKKKPDLDGNLSATLHRELGELYYSLTDYEAAKKFTRVSLEYYERTGDLLEIFKIYNLLESIFWDLGNEESAREVIEKRITLEKSQELPNSLNGMLEAEKKTVKLLVADDENSLEELFRQAFQKELDNDIWTLEFAADGKEALEKIHDLRDVEVLLLDINMPELDGLEVLDRLNAMGRNDIKVIMVTAYADMENIRSAMNRGAFDFVTKPVDFKNLKTTIIKAVRQIEIDGKRKEAWKNLNKAQLRILELKKERDTVSQLLKEMLPEPHKSTKGFEIHALMQQAQEEVGGDFFDYFYTTPLKKQLTFLIGDASLKGISSLYYMIKSFSLLKAMGRLSMTPNNGLKEVNQILCSEKRELRLANISAFLGTLDVETGDLRYSTGGGPLPYLLTAAGELKQLPKSKGAPLGSSNRVEFDSRHIQLKKDDLLLLYSDGVLNLENPNGEHFGAVRLENYLSGQHGGTPEYIVEGLYKELMSFSCGQEQFDDITILALFYKGKNGFETGA